MITETQRLYLRKITQADYAVIAKILQDDEAMFAYMAPFLTKQWRNGLII